MVLTCSVVRCTNRSNTNSEGEKVSYHRFLVVIESQGEKTQELSSKRRLAWIAALKQKGWEPSEHSRVCSDHFVSCMILNLYGINLWILHLGNPSKLYEETSSNWIPSLRLGWDAETPDSERYYCAEQRKRRKLNSEVEAVEEPMETFDEQIDGNSKCVNMVDVACETDDCSWMLDKAGEI